MLHLILFYPPPTRHQLLCDDSKAHQTGDVIPPVCPGSDPGVTSWLDMDNEARSIYTWARFNFFSFSRGVTWDLEGLILTTAALPWATGGLGHLQKKRGNPL